MEKFIFLYLIVLPGICCSSEIETTDGNVEDYHPTDGNVEDYHPTDGNVEDYHPTELFNTTTYTYTTKAPDSTSDSWADIYPDRTTAFTTTTSTASTNEITSVPDNNDDHLSNEQSSDEIDKPAVQPEIEEVEGKDEDCDENVTQEEMRKFSQAIMAFGIDLLKEVDPESKKPSVILSPFSIALGLFQLSLGAGKDMEQKILETLHVESAKCLHNKLNTIRKELTQSILRVATRMYIKKEFIIKKSFLERSEKWYGTKPVNLAKSKQENLESINKWVKAVTDGKIPHFLSDVPENLVLILLNAMHFKGVWRHKFDPNMTAQDSFHINERQSVPVAMMQANKYPFSWYLLDHMESQVARLPFKGNMSLLVIMPLHSEWNISKILHNFNKTELYSRFPKERPTLLRIPKLHLDYKLELSQTLTSLGLGQLFTNPQLCEITDKDLVVSSVQHQSTLELNEEGVEASAATAVLLSRSLATYSINRPFLFFLFDDNTGLPLFMGHVHNPNPGYQKKKKDKGHSKEYQLSKGSIPK
ncbi:alpha-2-antiplasmin [Rhinophrynus dorsalis]